METSKVVRILIAVFLLLSVLFFTMYLVELNNKTVLDEGFVNDAVTNLENNGIKINQSVINRNFPEIDIYTFNIDSFDKHNNLITDALSTAVFGKKFKKENFEVPGGEAVAIYLDNDSNDELGRIVFSNTDLSFKFALGGITINGIDQPISGGNTAEISASHKKIIKQIIGTLADKSKTEYVYCGSSVDNDTQIITVKQTVNGTEINDFFMNFVFQHGALIIVSGKWIVSPTQRQYQETLLDGINVLYKLDLENVKEIISEKVVYSVKNAENNEFYLIPEWEIEYVDSNDELVVSYIDAL